eukprot:GSChrysophyteH1.ASY1.ANO1.3270.1 assembled CDS
MKRCLSLARKAREFDFIVIGAGSSGSVVASKLSENPSNRVLLVEGGEDDNYLPIHVPSGYLHCIANPRTDWCFKTAPQRGLGDRELYYPRGKTLGGSSSINGMIYMRGVKADYDAWADEVDNEDWRWDNLLPLWKEHEDYHGLRKETLAKHHGSGGRWTVSTQRVYSAAMETFRDAAIENGIPPTADFNQGDNSGVGFFDVNQRDGWRLTAYRAFVVPRTVVKNLEFERSRDGRPRCLFTAKKEVVLCAGSIGSVQILERSGIGEAERLQRIDRDVPVIADLPGVGENLHDHLQIRPVFGVSNVPGGTLNSTLQSWRGKIGIAVDFLKRQEGPLTVAPSCLGAFTHSSEKYRSQPNLEFHIQNLSLAAFGGRAKIVHSPLDSYDAITAAVVNVRPTSRGSVHITSTDVHEPPSIDPNYLDTAEDRQVALDSLRLMRSIVMETAAFAPYNPVELRPTADIVSDEQLLEAVTEIGTTIFHPVSTTRMGRASDSMAVVDGELRVFGVDGLRVADAGVMPHITSGNTAAPTMVIGERCARYILRDHCRSSVEDHL